MTDNGNLTSTQAKIDLALSSDKNIQTVLKVNLRGSGIKPVTIQRTLGNIPNMGAGGGTEYIFNQNIPSKYIISISTVK